MVFPLGIKVAPDFNMLMVRKNKCNQVEYISLYFYFINRYFNFNLGEVISLKIKLQLNDITGSLISFRFKSFENNILIILPCFGLTCEFSNFN